VPRDEFLFNRYKNIQTNIWFLIIVDREGRTPICYSLNSKVLKTLVDAGADATVIDNNGWNVLMNVIANPSRYKRDLGMRSQTRDEISHFTYM